MRWARRSLDLLAILALTAAAVVATAQPVDDWVRTILDLPLILFFPGYALTGALFRPRVLGGVERLAYSLAGSLAVAILVGIVVQTAFALNREVWVISMAATVAVETLAASVVRRGYPAPESPQLRLPGPVSVLGTVLAAGLAAAAIAVASGSAADARSDAEFTGLSMLPIAGPSDADRRVSIKVENETGGVGHYKLQVQQGRRQLASRHLAVADGSTWTGRIAVASPIESRSLTATLWREGRVYRRVYLRGEPSP